MAQKNIVNPLAAAMIGAAVGAAAVALSNKSTRDKIAKAANDLPKTSQKTMADIKERVLHLIQKEEKNAHKQISQVKKKVSKVKSKLKMANGHRRQISA